MFAKALVGTTLVALLLPLSVLAQEDETTDEQVNGVVVEERESAPREQALESIDTAIEQNPEAATFGLETAREAVNQGGMDGQAVSDTASDGRSTGAGGKDSAGGSGGAGASGGAGGGAGGGGA
ncbi:hypothetical protein, partial [Halomonas sp. BC04]|uniref:hypothetical protein n=1 Tax=Halomonas sp. BC04 TaxID=1403540 RepID=UPI0005BE9850